MSKGDALTIVQSTESDFGRATRADYTFDSLHEFVGRELCISDWFAIDQARIDRFALCTGDDQWIHVDVERCKKESPYGAPIAHGFLTLSLLAPLLMQAGVIPPDASRAINCGVNDAKFLSPVVVGDRVRSRITLVSAERKDADRVLIVTRHFLEVEGREKPGLTADLVVMIYR
jgi:acyl dehydratase